MARLSPDDPVYNIYQHWTVGKYQHDGSLAEIQRRVCRKNRE